MTLNLNKTKSRSLTLIELFNVLQEEYVVCELRVKIYPLEKHKQYWSDLMQKKKDKIIDIAKKNAWFSIFDDKRIKQDYDKRIIPEVGFPNFIYKDDAQRLLQEKWDIHNYYLPGAQIKVFKNGSFVQGVIKSVHLPSRKAKAEFNNTSEELELDSITRVL